MVVRSDMPEARSLSETIQSEVWAMHCAQAHHQGAYSAFLIAAQAFEWEHAATCQLAATVAQEAAMDAFVGACRARQAMEAGDDA